MSLRIRKLSILVIPYSNNHNLQLLGRLIQPIPTRKSISPFDRILCFSWLGAGRQCPNNAPGCVPARLEMDSLTTAASKKQTFGYIIEADVSHPSTRKTAIASSLLCCGFVTLLNSDFEGKGINPFYISKTSPLVVCLNECFVFPLFAHEIK